jgi:1-hydroxycarotenoid 3,4-desaturase
VKTAIVIGAGVGGLAAAIQLGRAGVKVRLYERAAVVGGKLRELDLGGRKILGGPSVLTMRWVFDELFDGRLADYLTLAPVDPLCRHFFSDGSQLDLFTDAQESREAIRRFAGSRDADGYMKFRKQAHKIFDIVKKPFMEEAIPSLLDFMSPRSLWQLTQIDGMRTLMRAVEDYFVDPRLRQLFARYATYNGSSPYHAPATLSVIAHVENAFGIFACRGGIRRLGEALEKLARDLGVELITGADIECLTTETRGKDEQVTGVQLRGAVEKADLVVANCDVAHVYEQLLARARPVQKPAEKYAGEELSLSAYVLLAVVDRAPIELAHHNVFFSTDYAREFDDLLARRRPPEDPTVYLCADDRVAGTPVDPDGSEGTERAFLLTNAPPRDAEGAAIDWIREAERCRERILHTLARHGWSPTVRAFAEQTPVDFERRFPHSKGALYGLASNSKMAAFKRPPNQIPGLGGLYLAGGTVHPGAGLPMVCLSARMATQLALQELHGERDGR